MGRFRLLRWLGCLALPALLRCAGPSEHEAPAVARQPLPSLEARIGPEFPISHPTLRDSPLSPVETRVASGPNGYLLTFPLRHDPSALRTNSWPYDAAVARVSPSGELLDPVGILLGPLRRNENLSSVIHVETHWLALWHDDGELRCSRVTEDGANLDPGGQSLGVDMDTRLLSYDGSHVLVLGDDGRVMLVSPDCSPASAPAVAAPAAGTPAFATPRGDYRQWSLDFDGTSFLVGYSTCALGTPDGFGVQRVSRAGQPIGAPIAVASATWVRDVSDTDGNLAVDGSVAYESGVVLVAYTRSDWDPVNQVMVPGDLRYRELRSDDTFGPEHTLVFPSTSPKLVAPGGNGFILYEFNPRSTFSFAKVQPDGTDLARSSFGLSEGGGSFANVATHGGGVLLANRNTFRIFAGNLALTAGPTRINQTANRQAMPAVASAGGVRWVVWKEFNTRINGSRVSSSGEILDPAPQLIHEGGSAGSPLSVAITSNGSESLVVVRRNGSVNERQVIARRLSPEGILDATPITLATGTSVWDNGEFGGEFAIASDGADYLVAWSGVGVRVSRDGRVLDPSPFSVGTGSFGRMALAFDGFEYLAALDGSPIVFARIGRDGSALGTTTTPFNGMVRGLGFAEGRGFLTWVASDSSLMGARVGPRGVVIDTAGNLISRTPVFGNSEDAKAPVAWDGTTWWVLWQDRRRGFSYHDAYAARITQAGVPLDGEGILLALGYYQENHIGSAVVAERGAVFAAYPNWDPSHGIRETRVHARLLSNVQTGGGGTGGGGGIAGAGNNGGSSAGVGGSAAGGPGMAGTGGGSAAGAGAGGSGGAGGTGGAGNAGEGGFGASGGSTEGGNGGEPDAGGQGGSSGSEPRGGTAGNGGAGDSAGAGGDDSGTSGRGGSSAGGGSGADGGGEAGAADGVDESLPDESCSCRTVGGSRHRYGLEMALLIGLALVRRWRRPPARAIS
jgi:hypothetical protein